MDQDQEHLGNVSQAGSDALAQSGDMGDVFALSQLLFIVGHVALKHVVYLEPLEPEWKRQKDG